MAKNIVIDHWLADRCTQFRVDRATTAGNTHQFLNCHKFQCQTSFYLDVVTTNCVSVSRVITWSFTDILRQRHGPNEVRSVTVMIVIASDIESYIHRMMVASLFIYFLLFCNKSSSALLTCIGLNMLLQSSSTR